MENWTEIRRLHRGEGLPIKAIYPPLGISRNTVKHALLAERVEWTRSISVFRGRVVQLRPLFARTDPASRTTCAPVELVQCDL